MSLAKKYLGILFEDQAAEAPEVEMEAPAIEPEAEFEDDALQVACAELEDLVKGMEDGEMKDKLMAAAMKIKGCCEPEPEAPAAEEPEAEAEMDAEGEDDEACKK